MAPKQASKRKAENCSEQEKRNAESDLASNVRPKRRALENLSNVRVSAANASNSSDSKRILTTDKLALIPPMATRTRAASKAQKREKLDRQPASTETADSLKKLKKKLKKKLTAQPEPDEGTESMGKVSLSTAGVFDCNREDYVDDIFEYMKQREAVYKVNYYLNHQPELKNFMRSMLVDWLAEQQQTEGLYPKTLFLAVKIIDAYLSKQRVAKDDLKLLGTVALWIACKYEEHQTFSINELLDISDNKPKQKEVRKLEKSVLRGINFDLGFPLSLDFLRRYAQCSNASTPLLSLASYILEFSLMFYSFIQVKDSAMASAVLFMARRMNDQEGWNATLEHHSGYKVADFAHIVKHLDKLLRRTPAEGIASIKIKYSQANHHKVAEILLKDINSLFEDYPEALA